MKQKLVISQIAIFLLTFTFLNLATVWASQDVREKETPVIKDSLSKLRMQPLSRVEAPDFSLKNLSGRKVRLTDFRGKVVLMNFWTTW